MKKNTALLLAIILILSMFAGCSGNSTEPGSDVSSEAIPSSDITNETADIQESSSEPTPSSNLSGISEDIGAAVQQVSSGDLDFTAHKELLKSLKTQLPITTEDVTLTYWIAFETAMLKYIEDSDLNNHPIFKNMKDLTGVHIELIMNDRNTFQEKFNLMIASGNWADFWAAENYTAGVSNAYEEGLILDLTDLIAEYAPNYTTIINSDSDIKSGVTTEDGLLLNFYNIKDEVATPTARGTFIRQDWLDDLNMTVPTTYDELHDVLTAFKVEKGAEEPMLMYNTIVPDLDGLLIGGYGTNAVLSDQTMGDAIKGYYQVDGTVLYGATQEGTREFLRMLNQFKNEGLINFENMLKREGNPFADITAGYAANGVTGYFHNNQPFGGVYGGMSQDPNINFWPVQDVAETSGQIIPFFEEITLVALPSSLCISSTCAYPEIAVSWCDYWYSYDGYLLANYGQQGVDWDFDENGVPQYNPDVLAQYETVNLAFSSFTTRDLPYVQADNRLAFSFDDRENACFEAWSTNKNNDCIIGSKCVFNIEETTAAANIYGDILTYVSTSALQFINGDLSLDSDWDNYVATIEGMNLSGLTALVQSAYDRAYK